MLAEISVTKGVEISHVGERASTTPSVLLPSVLEAMKECDVRKRNESHFKVLSDCRILLFLLQNSGKLNCYKKLGDQVVLISSQRSP